MDLLDIMISKSYKSIFTLKIHGFYRILYSTCDPDTTFYLQLLFQLNNELSVNIFDY